MSSLKAKDFDAFKTVTIENPQFISLSLETTIIHNCPDDPEWLKWCFYVNKDVVLTDRILFKVIIAKKPRLLRYLFDCGLNPNTTSRNPLVGSLLDFAIYHFPLRDLHMILDAGGRTTPLGNGDFRAFLTRRETVRLAAIRAMGAIASLAKGVAGARDISKIIGRAIWTLRGIQ